MRNFSWNIEYSKFTNSVKGKIIVRGATSEDPYLKPGDYYNVGKINYLVESIVPDTKARMSKLVLVQHFFSLDDRNKFIDSLPIEIQRGD